MRILLLSCVSVQLYGCFNFDAAYSQYCASMGSCDTFDAGSSGGGGQSGGGVGGGAGGGSCAGQLCLVSRTLLTNLSHARIWGTSSASLWLVGGKSDADEARVFHRVGNLWLEVSAPPTRALTAVAGSSDSDVVSVGMAGDVFQWDGGSWGLVGSSMAPAIHTLYGVTVAGGQRLAVGFSGVVMNGSQPNWTQEQISSSAVTLYDVHAAGNLAVAVGRDAFATHTTLVLERSGSNWGSVASLTSQKLNRVFLFDSDQGFAVGEGGFILHRTSAGWSQEFTTNTWILEAVWASSPNDVFAGGWGTTLLHRDTLAWNAVDLSPWLGGVNISDLLGFGTTELWLVGDDTIDTSVLQFERR